jgi:nitroreductase
MDKIMEQIMDIIKKRISIRSYKGKPLPKETIESILEAARYAPSARNLQQLEYKVIINKALAQKMSDSIRATLKKEMASIAPRPGMTPPPPMPVRPHFFYDAPLVIIITGPKDNAWIESDAALAVQNIMLYATSIDLGSCFIGMARLLEKDKEILRELHISDDRKIAAAVVCGYADEKPAIKEKRIVTEFFK